MAASPAAERPRPALRIRPMEADDIAPVVSIERRIFSTPWSEEAFRTLIGRSGTEARVVVDGEGERVAYAVLWHVLDQGELANLAVRPERQGAGIGGWLLDRMMEIARGRGVRHLYLEVRESNEAARALYAAHGFREVSRRRNYYREPTEDALVLEKRLG